MIIFIPCSWSSLEIFKVVLGLDLVSLGITSILKSSILFIASLVAFSIELPISLYSPDKGTTKPILIFSSAELWKILSIKPINVKIINWIKQPCVVWSTC